MSSTLLTIDNIVVWQFDIRQFRVRKLSVRKVEIRHCHIVPSSRWPAGTSRARRQGIFINFFGTTSIPLMMFPLKTKNNVSPNDISPNDISPKNTFP
jgi:hypothetical protein